MAVLGSGGRLELRREAPSPCVILPDAINLGTDSFEIACEGYWPGDHVVISGPDGLPIIIDGAPQRWDGVATYFQNTLFVADNRVHITASDHQFYKAAAEEYPTGEAGTDNNTPKDETTWFYYRGQNADESQNEQLQQLEGYLCVDSLGRVKLYKTRCEGMACCGDGLLNFSDNGNKIDFDFIVINQYGTGEYQNAILNCLGEIGEYIYNDVAEDDGVNDPDLLLNSICNDPPLYLNPIAGIPEYDNADVQPRGNVGDGPHPLWTVMCDIREWSLELDAPSVDTTGVGEKFGEAVKSLVTGGGSADFFIDRSCYDEGIDNGMYLMRLLLMTQMDGCRANARFYMIDRGEDCSSGNCGELNGALWYETDILVTRNAVNLRPTDLVAGTANFVTTGEIKLLAGSPVQTNSNQGNSGLPKTTLTSESFNNGSPIPPSCYYNQGTCPGNNHSPQLSWKTDATDVATWQLRCSDRSANNFLHWSVNAIPAATTSIASNAEWPAGVVVNTTDWDPDPVRNNGWGGPCPPAGTGTHTYLITIEGRNAAGKPVTSGRIEFTAAP